MAEEDDDRAGDDLTDLWVSDAGPLADLEGLTLAEADDAERRCGAAGASAAADADAPRRERAVYLGFLRDMLLVFALKFACGLPALWSFWRAGNLPPGQSFLGLEATTMANVDLTFTAHSGHYDDVAGYGFYGLGEPLVLWGLDQVRARARARSEFVWVGCGPKKARTPKQHPRPRARAFSRAVFRAPRSRSSRGSTPSPRSRSPRSCAGA